MDPTIEPTQQAPENQDTPENEPEPSTEAAPDDGTREPQKVIDWEKRYRDLRSEFDRRNQEGWPAPDPSDENDDDDLLALMGYEEDPGFDDPTEALLARIENLEQTIAQQREAESQAQAQQRDLEHINAELRALQRELGREFTEEAIQLIGDQSQLSRDEFGRPDVRAAYELIYGKVLESEREAWIQSKPTRSHVPAGGPAGEKPDLDTPAGRKAYMAQQLANIAADQ